MKDLQQRVIAMSGVIVFFLSTIALSVFVVVEALQDKKNPTADKAPDTANAENCQPGAEAQGTLPAPEAFTAENVNELQTTDLEEGSGQAAKAGDCLVMKYYGTLASNGEVFDENFTQPTAFAFQLGQGRVIRGWDQGLEGIKEGGTRRLVIPAELAYGEQSPSEKIPANSALVFTVKLLRIQK